MLKAQSNRSVTSRTSSGATIAPPTLSLIRHLSSLRPTWLLLSSDFAHNAYAPEVLAYCAAIVAVGRVRWIPDSPNSGKDNAAWYLFHRGSPALTIFYGRGDREPVYSSDIEAVIGRARDLKDLL